MSSALAIGLAVLTALALALLLLPLLGRQQRPATRDAYNLAVYRDQLAELDRDLARGLLTAEQAEAARAEIGRRILALDHGETRTATNAKPLAAAIVAILALPVAALLIYARLGSPSLPDQPFAARGAAATKTAAESAAQTEMQEALAKLRAHLKTRPEDLTGWLLLARSELALGRFPEAAEAYGRAAELSGNRADIAGLWGEALVMAADGTVTAAAARAFEAGLKDPEGAPRARYYLGLAQLQRGDAKAALQAWADLAADSPADAEWLPLLRQRIAEAAKAIGIDPASVKAADRTGMPSPDAVAAAAQAAAAATPEEKRAMIDAMVERLAARLAEQPDDAEGWARLGRSYMVLRQPAKARDAYARAARLKPGDAALARALAEASRDAAEAETRTGAPPARPRPN